MRLIFHDCMRYTDGSGGCDGCINWKGIGVAGPSPNDKNDFYRFDPINETDNNGMDQIAEKLELIYTSLDWPFQNTSLEVAFIHFGSFPCFKGEFEADRQVSSGPLEPGRACSSGANHREGKPCLRPGFPRQAAGEHYVKFHIHVLR